MAVANMTPSELGKAILVVLQDNRLYHKLQAGALSTAKQHSEADFIGAWKSVLSAFF
ncbi:glycosyl transferase group 1 [Lacticaseibacillus rhamnosus MTCC 5462]|nr:glycosyl transferase group 1 [Lacticaseibacillus rhamnosus MTCC 5462]